MKIRIHFNKRRAGCGEPWTLHTSKECIPAAHVRILVPIESEERPDRRSNPRYFFICYGRIHFEGETAVIDGM